MRTLNELIQEIDSQMIKYHECNNEPLIPNKESLDLALKGLTGKDAKRYLEWLVRRIYTYRDLGDDR